MSPFHPHLQVTEYPRVRPSSFLYQALQWKHINYYVSIIPPGQCQPGSDDAMCILCDSNFRTTHGEKCGFSVSCAKGGPILNVQAQRATHICVTILNPTNSQV
ncbi:hypothetical protein PR048_005719 [Dryococelus australis]|uniref:Uncharacterized protein n=1 Tax=Dryococelus australis TaxID=614101 RepID=A0ABQ9I9Y0_9NEOP|nr:hypothetical protein PR048_005719 [Dryococelus australis]